MFVQLALDFIEMENAVGLVRRVSGLVDIVEVGTPVILRDGVGAVRRLHEAFPGLRILADLKIADGGTFESSLAFHAGASIVTVLATAADETVQDAVRAGAGK
jgi:3-hexulose-6-phosphate synthase